MNNKYILKKHKTQAIISQSILRESAIMHILNKFSHNNLISGAKFLYNYYNYYTIMPCYGIPIRTNLELNVRDCMKQLVSAVSHLHKLGIVHRDITMNNILIKNDIITLIDYGMSDFIIFDNIIYNPVCTMTYRPIEILLGYDKFGISQDIWSIGCIMLFLSCKDIIIFGNNEIEQIFSIYTVLGFPNSKILSKLPHFKNTYPKWTNILKKYINDDVYDLVYQMLNYDFNKRISTEQILQHKYFI